MAKTDKMKQKGTNAVNKVKIKAKNYKDGIIDSYSKGYERGWNDCVSGKVPFGSAIAGGIGYSKGHRARQRQHRADKVLARNQK